MPHPDACAPDGAGRRGITLVLGGGGARGLAHLGVLKVLEEEGIAVSAVVGNSAGAIMGAAWLGRTSATEAIDDVLAFMGSRAFGRLGLSFRSARRALPARTVLARILSGWRRHVAMHLLFRRQSLFQRRRIEFLIHAAAGASTIESLRLPLWIVALDVANGEEVVLERGDLREALTASASVAGFFPPVQVGGRLLIDAGLADNLPVGVAVARGGRPIVAVNLSRELDQRVDFATGIELLLRSEELGSRFHNRQQAALADLEIAPRVGDRYWLDFSHPESIVAAGEAAARAVVPQLRALTGLAGVVAPAAETNSRSH